MSDTAENYLKLEDLPGLYRKHLREIVAYIYSFVHNDDDAREMTQDVFYKVCEQIKRRSIVKGNFRAYLYKTARNHVIDVSRKKTLAVVQLEERDQPVGKTRASHENQVIDAMMLEDVSAYIDTKLSEKESAVFKLRFYQDLKLEEIAEVMESSIAGISRLLQKVLRELEKKFPGILD